MNQNHFGNLKNTESVSLYELSKAKDPVSSRNMRVFKYAFGRQKWAILGQVFLGLTLGCFISKQENIRDNFITSHLTPEEIRYNREFQRMCFLDEPKMKTQLEDSLVHQYFADEGIDMKMKSSRKDLHKKSPHFSYF